MDGVTRPSGFPDGDPDIPLFFIVGYLSRHVEVYLRVDTAVRRPRSRRDVPLIVQDEFRGPIQTSQRGVGL